MCDVQSNEMLEAPNDLFVCCEDLSETLGAFVDLFGAAEVNEMLEALMDLFVL